jgi:hypothetical protein
MPAATAEIHGHNKEPGSSPHEDPGSAVAKENEALPNADTHSTTPTTPPPNPPRAETGPRCLVASYADGRLAKYSDGTIVRYTAGGTRVELLASF